MTTDQEEKLAQAEEWLKDPDLTATSVRFKAIVEHITWVLQNTQDPVMYARAQALMDPAKRIYEKEHLN